MKKTGLYIFFFFLSLNSVVAHSTICINAPACDSICPNPEVPLTSAAFTLYTEVITMVLDSAYHNGNMVAIDSLFLISVTGLPERATWLTECGNGQSCKFFPDTTCILIGGTPITAGTYTLTINIQVFSETEGVFMLNLPNYTWIVTENLLDLTTSATEVSSFGLCDGDATVSANKGEPPYTYLWETGETTKSIAGKCSNIYKVVVTDSTGIKDSINAYISEPSITITPTPDDPTSITDTITGHLDTCIINCDFPIDSAVITSYTLLDSTRAIFYFRIYHFQNGNTVDLSTVYRYNKEGRTLVVLQLNCEGQFTKALKSCYIEDDIFIDYSEIGSTQIVVGIDERLTKESTVAIYPNPFKNNLSIQVELETYVKIVSAGGVVLLNTIISAGTTIIETANYAAGLYTVVLNNNESTNVLKAIKVN